MFYTSTDATNWDEGFYYTDIPGAAYYSNNIRLTDEKGDFLLVQYSSPYYPSNMCVHASHMKVRIKK